MDCVSFLVNNVLYSLIQNFSLLSLTLFSFECLPFPSTCFIFLRESSLSLPPHILFSGGSANFSVEDQIARWDLGPDFHKEPGVIDGPWHSVTKAL